MQQFRTQSQEFVEQYFVKRQHEKQEMRRLVEATSAELQNVKEARAKLTAMKKQIGMLITCGRLKLLSCN